MVDYSQLEAANRAGVSVDELSRLVELGVLGPGHEDRFTAGDVRKVGLLHSLAMGGLPLDGLVADAES